MKTYNFIGFDLGASNGRAMLGRFDGERLEIEELHRFPNDPVQILDRLSWDVQRLFYNIKQGLLEAARRGIEIDAVGIDTWGCDFGLIDRCGNLVCPPVHYRDLRNPPMIEKAYSYIPEEEIFAITGESSLPGNTLFQLLAMKEGKDPALEIADKLMFMPDLLAYFLTGVPGIEYTVASTSQLMDVKTRTWSEEMFEKMGLPRHLMMEPQASGTVRGMLRQDIADELGIKPMPVIATACHDTAAAVAAVPTKDPNYVYISSGTWSLFGTEIDEPMTEMKVLNSQFNNEGGLEGRIRLIRNVMGMWLIQECKREWEKYGDKLTYPEIVAEAEKAEPFRSLMNVDDPMFYAAGSIPGRIREYCIREGQPVPETRGQFARMIYEDIALRYRWALEHLENHILGHRTNEFHIVGGGSNNAMLNQMTADAINRPVIVGPSEGTVIGNLLVQGIGIGVIRDQKHLREIVERSFPTKTFMPGPGREIWDEAYERFLKLLEK